MSAEEDVPYEQVSSKIENHHPGEGSEISCIEESSKDEKTCVNNPIIITGAQRRNPIVRDGTYPLRTSYQVESDPPPNSLENYVASSIRGSHLIDPGRLSRSSYVESYHNFDYADLEDESQHDEWDDGMDHGDDGDDGYDENHAIDRSQNEDLKVSVSKSQGMKKKRKRGRRLKVLGCSVCSSRGILNVGAVMLLAAGLVTLFVVLPILTFLRHRITSQQLIVNSGSLNLGGINATGQVPVAPDVPVHQNMITIVDQKNPLIARMNTHQKVMIRRGA